MRDQVLTTTRINMPELIEGVYSPVELFQNMVLRPILKFQHEFVIEFINQRLNHHFPNWKNMDQKDALRKAESLMKEAITRNTIIGAVIGLTTLKELNTYHLNENEYKRRIVAMACKRWHTSTFDT